jgi:hypothetical protein
MDGSGRDARVGVIVSVFVEEMPVVPLDSSTEYYALLL